MALPRRCKPLPTGPDPDPRQIMNVSSIHSDPTDTRPILIVPYMWIGDFVRGHSVIKLLRARFPSRPIDVLTTTMVAPLLDYMPGVRKGIVVDLPRKRLALREHRALAERGLRRTEGGRRELIGGHAGVRAVGGFGDGDGRWTRPAIVRSRNPPGS